MRTGDDRELKARADIGAGAGADRELKTRADMGAGVDGKMGTCAGRGMGPGDGRGRTCCRLVWK